MLVRFQVEQQQPTVDRTIDRQMPRLIYDRSQNPTIDRTIDRRVPRLIYDLSQNPMIDRTIDRRVAALSGATIDLRSVGHLSYDFLRWIFDSCHRSSPIVVDRATTRTNNRR